jgi:hypothetical protein
VAGWFTTEDAVDCYKNLWNWEDDAPINIIIDETSRLRYGCRGYHKWTPGRSPADHLKLEDERRSYRYQFRLAILAFLGSLVGALIGAFIGASK